MKHYPKIKTQQLNAQNEEISDVVVSDISIGRLVEDGLLVLYREIKQLKLLSAKGKLAPNDSRDLRDHLKLLFELKDREDAILTSLSEEELRAIAQQQSNDNKQE